MLDGAPAAAAFAAQRHFIGTITPSGNTVVERVTLGVLRHLPAASAHFSRTPVHGSSDPSPDAYVTEGLLAAARLLQHASPQVLLWNGSKGVGIGFGHDHALAALLARETGIRATTSVIALERLLRARGIARLAVVTPYSPAGHAKALDCLAREGFACTGHAAGGLSDNLSYAGVPPAQIMAMARAAVAGGGAEALLCLCTNFPAAVVAAPLEAELGIPVYDTTALGVWHALRLAGCDTTPAAAAWGSLFAQEAP